VYSLHCLCGTRTDQGEESENEINVTFSGPTHPSEKLAVRKQALRHVAWYGCDTGSMGLITVEENAFLCKKKVGHEHVRNRRIQGKVYSVVGMI
jgi:hypothetical protein